MTEPKKRPTSKPKKPRRTLEEALKSAPSQYKMQLIALNHYLNMKRDAEKKLTEDAQNTVAKYKKARIPIINEAASLIAGERAADVAELNYAKQHLGKSDLSKENQPEAIPEYWFMVLSSCRSIAKHIYGPDHKALKKLTRIQYDTDEAGTYFSLSFYFAPNDFFINDVLTLRLVLSSEGGHVKRVEATPIKWKPGRDLNKKVVQKKQQNKKTQEIRTITTLVPANTFFDIFKSMRIRGTPEQQKKTERELGFIQDLAITFRDEILVYHLEYYLGTRNTVMNLPASETFAKTAAKEKEERKSKSPSKSPTKNKSPQKCTLLTMITDFISLKSAESSEKKAQAK